MIPAADIRTTVRVPITLPLGGGTVDADVTTFDGLVDQKEHLLLALGPWRSLVDAAREPGSDTVAPLVRLHSECLTGDVFGSERCDCGPQLHEALERLSREGGFILYLRQEGRGIGLYEKLDAYALQDSGLDTYEANVALGHGEDERDYTVAAQMLAALDVPRVRLLTNNPQKALQLQADGIRIDEVIPTGVHLTSGNARYLEAKRDHTAHTLRLPAA